MWHLRATWCGTQLLNFTQRRELPLGFWPCHKSYRTAERGRLSASSLPCISPITRSVGLNCRSAPVGQSFLVRIMDQARGVHVDYCKKKMPFVLRSVVTLFSSHYCQANIMTSLLPCLMPTSAFEISRLGTLQELIAPATDTPRNWRGQVVALMLGM